ncbi:hypothetical protein CMI47_15740 [Candidatus Pacearchaeota archaeon]|nr:hypothetical protein [Candidatus Pacearchaeota archaeon]|tara:strand:+ start:5213 stop:5956 length:744 start_codon:yes stop_codon:yes gene_type:complete
MCFVVFTSDKYLSLLHGFSELFNKYWDPNQHVHVLGFKEPSFKLPSNFEFISAGKEEDFEPKAFCGPFEPILKDLPGETLTYFLEDTFLISPLRKETYLKAKELIIEGKAHKVQLFWGGPEQYTKTLPYDETFRVFPQNLNYRCNLAPSVINKEYFLQYFTQSFTVWEFELYNMERARNDQANILVSWRDPISPWFNVVRHGRFNNEQWTRIEQSNENRFAWNKFQFIDNSDMDIFLRYKNWTAAEQ